MYGLPGSTQDWAGHFSRRAARNRRRLLLVAFIAFLLIAFSTFFPWSFAHAECDGFSLEVGIGAHDPGFDGPEYTTRNALGIVEGRYQRGRLALVLSHISSMENWPAVWNSPREYGYGANILSARYRLGPWQ